MATMQHPSADATPEHIFGKLTPAKFYAKHGVTHIQQTIQNSRGLQQCTRSWTPINRKPRGAVMVCHGYGADSGWFVQLTCIAIAKRGFAVFAIDHQGHGNSEGLKGFLPNLDHVVSDCIDFFTPKKEQYPGLPCFLYGESLGGAIALLMHLQQPAVWSGAILNAAMCGISHKFKPPWPLESFLHIVAHYVPTWPIVPTKDIPSVSFKEHWKRELARRNPNRYPGKPRAGTALELLRVVQVIQDRGSEVTLPLLVIHGELDVVTDPEGSKLLYKQASSSDKTLKIYPGMWHQLVGEPPENVNQVFEDVCSWLEARTRHE